MVPPTPHSTNISWIHFLFECNSSFFELALVAFLYEQIKMYIIYSIQHTWWLDMCMCCDISKLSYLIYIFLYICIFLYIYIFFSELFVVRIPKIYYFLMAFWFFLFRHIKLFHENCFKLGWGIGIEESEWLALILCFRFWFSGNACPERQQIMVHMKVYHLCERSRLSSWLLVSIWPSLDSDKFWTVT